VRTMRAWTELRTTDRWSSIGDVLIVTVPGYIAMYLSLFGTEVPTQ
jgi:hypothetical protein